jgi:small conductance mechanosensitive channel
MLFIELSDHPHDKTGASGLKTFTDFFLVLMISVLLAGTVFAQEDAAIDTRSIETLIETLDRDIKALRSLINQFESAEAADRDVLVYRQEERIIRLLADYSVLADKVAALPKDSPERLAVTELLSGFGVDLGPYLFERIDELNQRITRYEAQAEELSGAARIATQSYVFIMESTRVQSYESVVKLITSRSALGFSTENLRDQLDSKLSLFAETLAGRIESSSATRNHLQDRLSTDPTNTDIDAALKQLDSYHAFNIEQLEAVILMLDSLGIDSAEFQAVMLQQSDTISINFFSTSAILVVLKDSWITLKQAVNDNAANFIMRLLVVIVVLLVIRTLARITRRIVSAACDRSSQHMSVLLKNILVSTSGGTVIVLGILIALSQVGISLAPMLAGLGVAGFIVGFALQDSLGNFAAGAMILIYRPFDVDDLVEVPGAAGMVKKMNLVSTTITTLDNQTLVVPNSRIWGDVIKNVTAQRVRRVDLEFGIGYGDDIELAERVLTEIVSGHEKVLAKPEARIKLHSLGESSVNFIVRPWTRTDDYWDVYWDILREVKMRFDREGISIPFPQRDVHIYSNPDTES